MPNPQPSYILTRDTTCREGCPHYGHDAPAHSHYKQVEQPDPGPNWFWRAMFKFMGGGYPAERNHSLYIGARSGQDPPSVSRPPSARLAASVNPQDGTVRKLGTRLLAGDGPSNAAFINLRL